MQTNPYLADRRRTRADRRNERGSVTLELVVLMPVIMLIIFGTIQGALYFHGRNVALSAAQEGVRVARAENGTAGAAQQTARDFIDQAGGDGVLGNVRVAADRSDVRATVTVRGRPVTVIPGVLNFEVYQSASAPVERFTSPGGDGP